MQTGDLTASSKNVMKCRSLELLLSASQANKIVFAIIETAKTIQRTGSGLVVMAISSMILLQLFCTIL